MRVFGLRRFDLPDVGDYLVHFTGRNGWKMDVEPAITAMSPEERLKAILNEGRIRAFTTFGSGAPVVGFSESNPASIRRLIAEGRYAPFGIGFAKQFVFDRQGGPVLYVRGDEWDAATDALPAPLRSRLVRFWPGAAWEPGDPLLVDGAQQLPDHLSNPSEWLHEREWRTPADLPFMWDDVKFLIVPTPEWRAAQTREIDLWAGSQYAAAFSAIPIVVINAMGAVVHDDTNIFAA